MGLDLATIVSNVNKKFKKELAVYGLKDFVISRIPFSSPKLNYQCYGGIPRGRLIEFAGPESSGKTTTALDIISQAQPLFRREWEEEIIAIEAKLEKKPLKTEKANLEERLKLLNKRGPLRIVFFDCEGTLDLEWATKLNVEPDNIIVFRLQEHTAEQVLETCLDVIRSGECGLMVIDSIAPLIPQQIYDESLEKKSMGGNSAIITTFVNKAVPLLGLNGCTCIAINQVRSDMGNMYNEFITPGGNGLKHQCSLRLIFRKGMPINERGEEQKRSYDNPQGNIVLVHLQKTKVFKPDRRTGFYTLSYDNGIDFVADTYEVALQYDIIQRAGAWYTIVNPETGEYFTDDEGKLIKPQGGINVLDLLRAEPRIFDPIYKEVNRLVSMTGAQIALENEAALAFSAEALEIDEVDEMEEEPNE